MEDASEVSNARRRERRGVLQRVRRPVSAAVRLVWKAGRREFLTVMIMDIVSAGAIFVVLVQLQQLVAGLIASDATGNAGNLALNVVIFVAANTVIVIAEAIIGNRRQMLAELTSIYVRSRILEVACAARLDHFDDSAFHDRLQRTAISSLVYPTRMVESLVTIGQSLFALTAGLLALATVQPFIALLVLLTVVPIWWGGIRGGEQNYDFVVRNTRSDRNRHYLFDLLTTREAAKEIRAFNLEEHLADRWRRSMDGRLADFAVTLKRRFRSGLIASLGSGLVLALAAGALVGLNQFGVLSLAGIATAAGALLLVTQRLGDGINSSNMFFQAAPLVEDLDDFLALKATMLSARPGGRAPETFELMEVDDVSFTYRGSEKPAIDGVSLTIQAGEVVALVGENGSGKTTLTKLLAGLYDVSAGAIRVDGKELAQMEPSTWRENVAVLFQDFLRYALTAHDNVALGRSGREPTDDEIRTAARRAGADDFLDTLPAGYRTILSPEFTDGQDLSLGQWQRVALARAFFRSAPFVILDEPTASMDARAERDLFNSVRALFEGRTVLLISHRFSTVRTADRIVVLAAGKVVEQGSHDELMAAEGLYAELFNIQASSYMPDGTGDWSDAQMHQPTPR